MSGSVIIEQYHNKTNNVTYVLNDDIRPVKSSLCAHCKQLKTHILSSRKAKMLVRLGELTECTIFAGLKCHTVDFVMLLIDIMKSSKQETLWLLHHVNISV